jgi:long-chain fatty acid transport protein
MRFQLEHAVPEAIRPMPQQSLSADPSHAISGIRGNCVCESSLHVTALVASWQFLRPIGSMAEIQHNYPDRQGICFPRSLVGGVAVCSLSGHSRTMKTRLSIVLYIGTVVILLGSPAALFANGFRLPDQDGFATARGEAFAATADNPSAIYYNPAGIAQLQGENLRAGIYGVYLDPSFTPPKGSTTYENQRKLAAVPQFFYAATPENSPVSFGLGVYSPFGLSVDWPQNTGFRSLAIQGSLTYITINPAVAFKLAPNLMIGGGPNIDYANVDLRQGLSTFPGNDQFRFRGEGWDVGYNLGALWQPCEKISLAAVFRSSSAPDLHGHTRTEFNNVQPTMESPAEARFTFPLSAVFGASYRPTPKWNFEFDADYMDWSSVQTLIIHQDKPTPVLPVSNVPFQLDWESSWLYEFGGTRYFGNGWQVSAGYVFNENSMPNKHYTPYVADLDRHFFSVGTGFKGSRFNFDVAYQFGYGPDRTVTGSTPSFAGQTANGTYGYISHVILLSVGLHF